MEKKLSKRKQNNPINNPLFFKRAVECAKEKGLIIKLEYEKNPKICNCCKNEIVYEKRRNKYCSSRCSALTNNVLRTKEQHEERLYNIRKKYGCEEMSSDEIKNRKNRRKKLRTENSDNILGDFSKVWFKNCNKCNISFTSNKNTKLFCNACNLTDRKLYRKSCKFLLNNKEHSLLFNGELIKEFGWYAPFNSKSPNLTGVSWDHLFRIEDGFLLGVSPEIMRHPANAELVPFKENQKRRKSLISYEELLERIKLYESGNINKLKYFYNIKK